VFLFQLYRKAISAAKRVDTPTSTAQGIAMTNPNKLANALSSAVIQMDMAGDCIEAGRYDEALLHVRSMMRSRRKALAEHDAQPPPVADHANYVLVPRVPTPEMDAAGKGALSDNGVEDVDTCDALVCYAAMIAAAPQPAPVSVQADGDCGCYTETTWADGLLECVEQVSCAKHAAADNNPAALDIDFLPSAVEVEMNWSPASTASRAMREYMQKETAPAADGAGELLSMIDDVAADLTDHKSLAYEKLRKVRAAIAALRQPVPDAVRDQVSDAALAQAFREATAQSVGGHDAMVYARARELESALASQQES
jgi:hypothetical protein